MRLKKTKSEYHFTYISRFSRLIFCFLEIKVNNSLKILKKGGFCDMIFTVKREIAIEKELRSKIEWACTFSKSIFIFITLNI